MIVIGHRGACGLAPENTIAAFKKGLEYHVDQVEFDLRVTKDGIVIVHHDPFVKDPSGTKLVITQHTYQELEQHKPDLATFEEVMDFIDTKVHLYIEVKPAVPTAPIVKIIRRYLKSGMYSAADISLGSFDQKVLRELHAKLPDIEKVVIENWSGVRARVRARELNTKRLSMNQLWLWSGFLMGMQRAGFKITPYAVNSPAKAEKWQKYLYGIITDYPDRFEK